MALTIKYFLSSFNSVLPWSECREEWPNCISSNSNKSIVVNDLHNITKAQSSAEYYFM